MTNHILKRMVMEKWRRNDQDFKLPFLVFDYYHVIADLG
ncbi:hypothetical Protein YC6258_02834 [Gynuella sunshinyii YC6258]|uniref:Uncharacterized protein n=1 Tax=Gynuella sunshinyii YC6258 TaxID=1445510 RepID=A0A0C5VJN6_9GAMM|nr:hypothetical Protein YC6258_02834 [Gynuella sunshinyii YC6258]